VIALDDRNRPVDLADVVQDIMTAEAP